MLFQPCHNQIKRKNLLQLYHRPNYHLTHLTPLPDAETKVTNNNTGMNQAADSDRGEKTADNIRYGQNISESGQGGMTEGMGGDAADGMFLIFVFVCFGCVSWCCDLL